MMRLLKRAFSVTFPGASAALRERRQSALLRRTELRAPAEVFGEIYQNNMWGGQPGEWYSGDGSNTETTAPFVEVARQYISDHSIRRVVDLGCGDFRVGAQLLQPGLSYTGLDVVPDLIESHRRNFAGNGAEFLLADIVEDDYPEGDLYIVRQVLQHLSNAQIGRVLDRLRNKPHVLIAEHQCAPQRFRQFNQDKPVGRDIRVPLGSGVYPDQTPFSFPCRLIASTPVPPLIAAGERIAVYAKP